MGKLVGLLSSGIGLAIEAASEYQSSNKSVGKRTNSHYQPELTYESRDIYHDEHQAQRDAKAFQELQNYADFQRVLSNRVQDDIFRDEKYAPIDPQILRQGPFGDYFSHQPYVHPSLQPPSPRGALPCPVIIPQRRPEDKSRGWVRAYASVLMDCGIDQYTFLNFLDAFNESSKSSPYLDAVNVAGLSVGFAPGITPVLISMAVPVAVRMAKTAQTEKKSTDFLTRANTELFAPHNLFAMVMTYQPNPTSQTPINTQQLAPWQTNSTTTSPSYSEPQLPTSASLIFPEPEPTGSAGQQNKFKQIGHFIADYGDRRAQARYAFEHPDSSLATPSPTFRSRWGDPNNPANSSGLVSLISGRPRQRNDERKERKGRRRRGSGEGNKSSPGLIGSVRGMVNGPGKEDQSLIGGLRGMGMKKDILYLLIVNAPTAADSPPSINTAPVLTPEEHTSYPYRATKRIKNPPRILEPDPFQHTWTPDSGVGWLPNERYGNQIVPGSRGRSPPPAYSSPEKVARYERGEREYCVPTL